MAFPDRYDFPAMPTQLPSMLPVVDDVTGELVRPELPMALGSSRRLAALMPMPEASMDKNDGSISGQDNVRLPRQAGDMYSEPVACPMEERANGDLGAGILALDFGHQATAFSGGQGVCHKP